MAEKGETKILAIITICVILISIGLSGCVGDDGDNNSENDKYIFSIQFIPNDENKEYYLITPFPVHKNNQSELNTKLINELNDLKINYEIETTSFGTGLNISHKTELEILIKGESKNVDMFSYEPSIFNGTNFIHGRYHWVFSTLNGTFSYEFSIENEALSWGYFINTNLGKGWNSVKCDISKKTTD